MRERALALDDHPVRALRGFTDHELSGSGNEVRDDRVDGDAAARDRDPGLSRRHELGGLARASQSCSDLERRGHLPYRGVRPDREHNAGALAARAMPADGEIPGWLAQLAHPRGAALRGGGETGVREHAFMQSVPHLDPAPEGARQRGAIAVGDATARCRRPDEKDRRTARHGFINRRDDGHAGSDPDALGRVPPRPRRIDDRDHLERRVAKDSDRRLRGGGGELALGEDREFHLPPRSVP